MTNRAKRAARSVAKSQGGTSFTSAPGRVKDACPGYDHSPGTEHEYWSSDGGMGNGWETPYSEQNEY